jgi:hypothetical protein
MATLFVLQHLRKDPDGYDNLKLIGVFSSEDLAKKVLESHRALPGLSITLMGSILPNTSSIRVTGPRAS